jgi:hypothetical protein
MLLRRLTRIFLTALLVFSMLWTSCADSNQSYSLVLTSTEGEILVLKAGSNDWVKGSDGMVLDVVDKIKSGDNARAVVTFFDGSTIEIKPVTQIEIVELVKGKTKIIRLKQPLGDTISIVKKLADTASRYEIETPSAVAGVRGSSMLVSVGVDGTTTVKNLAGKISVSAQGVEVIIPAGKGSTVQPGQPPSTAIIIPYSASADYSLVKGNPNGNWSYGWMSIDFSKFNIYTTHDSNQWYGSLGGDRTPCIWMNNGGIAYGVPTGWLSLHPGPGKEPSVLRWTAPVSGTISIKGQFLAGDGGIMTVAIRQDGREIWTARDSGIFDLNVKVTAGAMIDFTVYAGYGFGNTPISATITYSG